MQKDERPVNALQASAELGVGQSYMSAVKRAMGIRSRYFFLSDIRAFIRKNPQFTVSQIYPLKSVKHPKTPMHMESPISPAALQTSTAEANDHSNLAGAEASPRGPRSNKATAKLNWWNLTLGDAFIAATGNASAETLAIQCKVSRETIRRLQRGEHIKLSTFNEILRKLGMPEEEYAAMLVRFLVAYIGDEAGLLRIEVANASAGEHSEATNPLVGMFNSLDGDEQQVITALIRHREMIPWFGGILRQLPSRPVTDGQGSTTQPQAKLVVRHPLPNRSKRLPRAVSHSPWAQL